MTTKTALTALATLGLGAGSANAAITLVSHNSEVDIPTSHGDVTADTTYTSTFTAGATADYLIVGTSMEWGRIGSISATYGGAAMTLLDDSSITQNAIFVLDLTEVSVNTAIDQDFDITLVWNGGSSNTNVPGMAGGGLAVAWTSLDEGTLAPGESLAVVDETFNSNSSSSTTVTTTDNGQFVFVNYNGNKDGTSPVTSDTSANLDQIYGNGSFASQASAAGYKENVAAGANVYTWDAENPRSVYGIAIGVVPEPGSLALLAAGGLLIASRRRRG